MTNTWGQTGDPFRYAVNGWDMAQVPHPVMIMGQNQITEVMNLQ